MKGVALLSLLGFCGVLFLSACSSSRVAETPEPAPVSPQPPGPPVAGCTFLGKNRQGYGEYRHDRTGIVLVALPGGRFRMGAPEIEAVHKPDEAEGPMHEVTVSPVNIGKYEVTQAQWKRVMRNNPSVFSGAVLPMGSVSWNDCRRFCQSTGLSLPSEAEWEYACRGGTTTPFSYGASLSSEQANFNGNHPYGEAKKGVYRTREIPVGSFEPNGFGLFDMHGNLFEWCEDVGHTSYEGAPTDGSAWVAGGDLSGRVLGGRVLRGGSWACDADSCRSAFRRRGVPEESGPDVGFRVVLRVRAGCDHPCAES